MTYTVDELNIPNTTLVRGDKGDVFCSKWPKNIVRFTRSEVLLVGVPQMQKQTLRQGFWCQ